MLIAQKNYADSEKTMLIAQKNHVDSGRNYFRQTKQVFPFANVLVPHSQAGSVPEGTPGGHPTAALGCSTLGCTVRSPRKFLRFRQNWLESGQPETLQKLVGRVFHQNPAFH